MSKQYAAELRRFMAFPETPKRVEELSDPAFSSHSLVNVTPDNTANLHKLAQTQIYLGTTSDLKETQLNLQQ
ncbi:hypothetical protein H310_09493 [Aphanomyces invadans]|uniref:Uncharacterized protein n=1 Tax=Aphanomyces invadans TaxID=157072 RepID=A0A024TW63_9STRA|nr:hypothetical protein H310_09493 [Aphanomyces invadans]ETV97597.1 hypothetical protein H310_09493 [Aphanomyces invadans]|eukprot:XP_008873806.1 hypothetical protein H310_09493 [Aphanomyces invadans]